MPWLNVCSGTSAPGYEVGNTVVQFDEVNVDQQCSVVLRFILGCAAGCVLCVCEKSLSSQLQL